MRSASSKTARALAEASYTARPMPTDCEPWPGNTNASGEVTVQGYQRTSDQAVFATVVM